MIIYNVTINIENEVHDEWLKWMREVHIPDVMKTGCFVENKLCRVLVEEETGTTYSFQYTSKTMDDYLNYKKQHAARLQKDVSEKFANKFVAFRTLLEVL
ncbi:MAG: DUF4286 family protein [Bacteroidia bacterium]